MSDPASIAVLADPDEPPLRARAAELAERLRLPVTSQPDEFDLLLAVTPERLELRDLSEGGPVAVDFVAGTLGRRIHTPAHGAAALGRAVGLKHPPWHVLDATAGLARDAFLLACLGCRVTAIERSAVLATLVADGLARARADGELAESAGRVELIVADARGYLAALGESDRPDAVYLDPMFPERRKSALVKKEMRVCRKLAGEDRDAADLLRAARSVARSRVTVKRPIHAPPLSDDVAFDYRGTTVRYDVYRPAQIRE